MELDDPELPSRPEIETSAEGRNESATEGAAGLDLARRLREATAEELVTLVAQRGEELTSAEALGALRNPFLSTEVAAAIARLSRVLASPEVKRTLAASPRTPEALAISMVSGLVWPDLAALGADVRVRPTVRRAADLALAARLPGLAVGEKIALARRVGAGVISALRSDPTPRVISALLENPRLTEGQLAPALVSEETSPAILRLVAGNGKWGARPSVRAILCKNPRTPVDASLPLLATLPRGELKAIAADLRLPLPLRRRAEVLSGGAG